MFGRREVHDDVNGNLPLWVIMLFELMILSLVY